MSHPSFTQPKGICHAEDGVRLPLRRHEHRFARSGPEAGSRPSDLPPRLSGLGWTDGPCVNDGTSPYTLKVAVRSIAQVAAAIRAAGVSCNDRKAGTLLRQLEREGFAEQADGGWRLTVWAERRFGASLRAIRSGPESDLDEAAA